MLSPILTVTADNARYVLIILLLCFIIKNVNMVTKFKDYLVKNNLTENTVRSYEWTVKYFSEHYPIVNKKNLLAYKGYLVENFKPQTVNLRLQAINKYLEFTKQEKLKLKFVKVQQKNFLENVISDADYKFFKRKQKLTDMMNGISLYGSWGLLEHVSVSCDISRWNM